jgi:hypothetical protein
MTLSALGIFSAAGAGGGVSLSDYELIESTILTGSQASITFSNLGTYSSIYKHLQIRAVIAKSAADFEVIQFNGDTNNGNYTSHHLEANGVGNPTTSNSISGSWSINGGSIGYYGSNQPSSKVIDILDAYSSTKNKTTRTLGGSAGTNANLIVLASSHWRNTASTTSLTVRTVGAGTYSSGSRFSIYGIR